MLIKFLFLASSTHLHLVECSALDTVEIQSGDLVCGWMIGSLFLMLLHLHTCTCIQYYGGCTWLCNVYMCESYTCTPPLPPPPIPYYLTQAFWHVHVCFSCSTTCMHAVCMRLIPLMCLYDKAFSCLHGNDQDGLIDYVMCRSLFWMRYESLPTVLVNKNTTFRLHFYDHRTVCTIE